MGKETEEDGNGQRRLPNEAHDVAAKPGYQMLPKRKDIRSHADRRLRLHCEQSNLLSASHRSESRARTCFLQS
jgi:hypothetical protein